MPIRVVRDKNPKIVLFYKASCPFSNFYPAKFSVEIKKKQVEFNCSEQYFMHHKALLAKDQIGAKQIMKMTKPLLMKRAGRKLVMSKRQLEEWSLRSLEVMLLGCTEKFSQNEDLRLALFRTHGMFLAEASARDKLWGIGLSVSDKRAEDPLKWRGACRLGKLLENVRDSLWEKDEFKKDRELVEKEDLDKRCEELRKLG